MLAKSQCTFHRNSNSLTVGRGIGYCDIDCAWVICDGDRKFCENPNALLHHKMMRGKKSKPLDFNPPSIPVIQEVTWR